MRTRRKVDRRVGRLGALTAAVLMAASVLVLPASTQPAVAQDACAHSEIVNFPDWTTEYDDRGVTLCRGYYELPTGTNDPDALVQIVDLAAGAKLRLHGEGEDPTSPGVPSYDNQYKKRLAHDWFAWLKNGKALDPIPERLFSTTNASFFVDTVSDTTALSLPSRLHEWMPDATSPGCTNGCYFRRWTYGWAYGNNSDPAWDATKRSLELGDWWTTQQDVSIGSFPTHYSYDAIWDFLDRVSEGTIAFAPSYGGGNSLRTFAGVNASHSKVYILTTGINVTLSKAQEILESFGSLTEVQLDGGGSAQMYYEDPTGGGGGISSFIGREVPDVLAVYLAPL